MGLGGGSGGGGTILGVSNAFTGPAEALEIAGNFAYAYSGVIDADTSDTTFLDFSTGNFLTVGKFEFFYTETPTVSGGEVLYTIKMAGTTIAQFTDRRDIRATPTYRPIRVIIPAYTPILATIKSLSAPNEHAMTFTGRIYR